MADKKKFSSRAKTQEINLGDSYLEPPKRYAKKQFDGARNEKKVKGNKRKNKKTTKSPDIKVYNSANKNDYGLEAPRRYAQSDPNEYRPQNNNSPKKKKNVRKRRKNKKALKIMTIISVFILLVILIFISLVFVFPVKEIKINGNEKYSYDEILKESELSTDDKMLLLNTEKSETALEKNLPYIRQATIKREFPNTLIVDIEEGLPKFAVQTGKKEFVLVDADFKVLENKAEGIPSGVIEISSIELKENRPGEILTFDNEIVDKNIAILANAVIKNQVEKITQIKAEDVNHSVLVYDDRINILFGDLSADTIDYKINQALASIDKLQETNAAAKGTLNLTDDKSIYFTEE